jgi:PAS domain S-box-containing protein
MDTRKHSPPAISILYVEDEQDAREILASVLAMRFPAIRLLVAENGGDGLEMFKHNRPDIVITDINMPVMNGIGMSAGIRKLAPETVIIALTAFSDADYLIKAIEIGMNRYLLKPIDQNELFSIIDASIDKILSVRRIKAQNDHIRKLSISLEQKVEERTAELSTTIHALHNEIAERAKAELALEQSREELNQAQRVAGAGSWLLDVRTGQVTWSDELYRIHGLSRNAPIPSYEEHGRLFTAKSLLLMQNAVATTLRTGEPHRHDLELIRPDGTTRWVTACGEAVLDKYGTIVMLRGISIDITERKHLERQLVEAKRLEAIGQLAGGLAHEVRNPLNAILSISEALFKEKGVGDTPEFEPYIFHIRTQVNRLAHLMNDLLDLGKPIPAASLHPVPLRRICGDAIKLLELSGVARGDRITPVWGNATSHMHVMADVVKLQQVVANLLENAIQHSPKGEVVVLRLEFPEPRGASGEMAVIRICDRGSGIPADRIDRVFEPFYSTRKGGTGLGLALVRHFIEHMGGEVRIRNNDPPPGCTAEVRIPLAMEGQV